ncbi:MAG: HlyD family efflux transporter periplasmic adaptor subunit [Bacteroidetes bacterium CHB5]|nr:HlyD family efflux transporter periplasmic adaptor subunit [Bacteroidetes bacterium CHB5]
MRKKLRNRIVSRFIISCLLPEVYFLLLIGCSAKQEAGTIDTYTCPMHPTVISDKQGVCPVCNMDLVRKARPGEEVHITEDLARLIKPPNETIVSQIKTVKGEYTSKPITWEIPGVVTYDTRYAFTIPVKIGGRLEKVYLKNNFQTVKKGMKVAEIYSQELVAAQQELIYLLNQPTQDETLLADSKSKLRLLGVSNEQLNELIASRKAQYQFAVYSDHDGYIIAEATAAPIAPAPSSMGMEPAVSQTPVVAEFIREGNYVTAGQTLFKVIDTRALRIELSTTPAQSKMIKAGDTVAILVNGKEIYTRVDFVQPFYETSQEFVTVRVNVPNTNLKIGELVKATWKTNSNEVIWIPREAIVDLGLERIVFVKTRNAFKAKPVEIQQYADDRVAVRGISSSDEIAAHAQFLVDSEGFIKNAH